MTIAGHHRREAAGNNTILVTHTLRRTILGIMPEVRSRLLFHHSSHHIHLMLGNLVGNILTTNKGRHLTTTVHHLTITDHLRNCPMETIHPEEAFVEL